MDVNEACPKCAAIYSRVEAYLKANPERSGPASRLPSAISTRLIAPTRSDIPSTAEFVQDMRAQSLYPTFRALAKWTLRLTYVFALGAVIAAFKLSGVGIGISTVVGALFFIVMATVAKEAALMIADLSDATVIQAAVVSSQARS